MAVMKLLLLSGSLFAFRLDPPNVCSLLLLLILLDFSLPVWEIASFSLKTFENISKNFYLFYELFPISILCKISFSLGYFTLLTYSMIISMLALLFLL